MLSSDTIQVAAGSAPQRIEVDYASHLQLILRVEKGATADLVETCGPLGAQGERSRLDIQLADGATLSHVRIVREPAQANAELNVHQERNSQYQLRVISTGSKSARNEVSVFMEGEGAACNLGGVSVARGHQHFDNQIAVLHRAPRTLSDQKFHQIAFDHGAVGIDAQTKVGKHVPGVQAHQSLRSLLMSPQASVHAKPELEIENDDIQCSHGATIGTLDEDQLFYLRARGIDQREAEEMLLDAFINEVLEPIRDPELRQKIRDQC